ncbi:MAG: hypothetical protein QNK37_02890 [Acidobacteriota bacterium]|nr:hypothetical protein [Acidobacteriota bacterium]
MPQTYNHAFFAEHLNRTFHLSLEEDSGIDLVMTECQKRDSAPEGWECFSVAFEGPPQPVLEQAIWELESEATGKFPIFLVPVEADARGCVYEAVYNLKVD